MKKVDPRSPRKKAKDAAYAKLGQAMIVHPLRFIRRNGPDFLYIFARHAARIGHGFSVKTYAKELHASFQTR